MRSGSITPGSSTDMCSRSGGVVKMALTTRGLTSGSWCGSLGSILASGVTASAYGCTWPASEASSILTSAGGEALISSGVISGSSLPRRPSISVYMVMMVLASACVMPAKM